MTSLEAALQAAQRDVALLVLDIDGTLIGASGDVSPQISEKLQTLQTLDLKIAVCTGRPWGGIAARIARDVSDPHTPHIFHGGALLRPTLEDPSLATCWPIPHEDLLALRHTSQQERFSLEYYTPSHIYTEHPDPYSQRHADLIGLPTQPTDVLQLIDTAPLIKAQFILPHADLPRLAPLQRPSLTYAHATSDVMPDVTFVTVTRRGVDKGSALTALLAQLQLTPSQVAAVGDSSGDLPMLELPAHPFVMRNASQTLQQRFPTLPHVDELGITPLLDALIAARR